MKIVWTIMGLFKYENKKNYLLFLRREVQRLTEQHY